MIFLSKLAGHLAFYKFLQIAKIAFLIAVAVPIIMVLSFYLKAFHFNSTRPFDNSLITPYPDLGTIKDRAKNLLNPNRNQDRYPCPYNMDDLTVDERIVPCKPRLLDPHTDCVGNEYGIEFVTYGTRCTSGLYLLAESL